jgi:hypothetical protein
MADDPQLLYLEPDDEITSVIRRLREAAPGSVVIVAPGRSRATSSVVALRLLARLAEAEGRPLTLVADAATRSLATDAGIPAFATLPEATSGQPEAPSPAARAPIHVVRGAGPVGIGQPPVARPGSADETMAVRLPPEPAAPQGSGAATRHGRSAGQPRSMRTRLTLLVVLLAIALAVGAAALPAATIRITPISTAVGPIHYELSATIAGHETGTLTVNRDGTATGERLDAVAATGSVVFSNWNTVTVEVPQGTQVSVAGGPAFITDTRIVVPRGRLTGVSIEPGTGSVTVTASTAGPAGNVAAGTVTTIDATSVRSFLRGFPENTSGLVSNPEATAGGSETKHAVIQQSDVDALVASITAELLQRLSDTQSGQPDRIHSGPSGDEKVLVDIPLDLVGKEDTAAFTLTGTLDFDRAYVMRADIEDAARSRLLADTTAIPTGTAVLDGSVTMEVGAVTTVSDQLQVEVSMRAASAAAIDEAGVRDRVAGLTPDEATTELADLGKIEVELWPGWVDHLPRLGIRISVQTVAPAASAS